MKKLKRSLGLDSNTGDKVDKRQRVSHGMVDRLKSHLDSSNNKNNKNNKNDKKKNKNNKSYRHLLLYERYYQNNDYKRESIKEWRKTNPRGRSQFGPGSNLYAISRPPSIGIIQNDIRFHMNAIQNDRRSVRNRLDKLDNLDRLLTFLKHYHAINATFPNGFTKEQLRNSIIKTTQIPENDNPSPVAVRKRPVVIDKATPRLAERVAKLGNRDVLTVNIGNKNFAYKSYLRKLIKLGLQENNYDRMVSLGPAGAAHIIPPRIRRESWTD